MIQYHASLPNFDTTPSAFLVETENILSTTRNIHDSIVASITPLIATFANVVQPLIDCENARLCRLTILPLFATVSKDQELRNPLRAAEKLAVAADTKGLMDKRLALLVAVVAEKWREGKQKLDAQAEWLLKRKHGELSRNGLSIKDETTKERYKGLLAELNSMLVAARKNYPK
ncbi:hypothetical protein BP5796_07114 [Coleophoma crateriformis]|uniref:Uncharacterized protein n=1 Tax=Coleophoma crateriformis TaxID=565419 RepID=A0A3D8RHZ8_9HELO|nr:hypothetical protein BP5796_07114 [Coleophoma crateriformis]